MGRFAKLEGASCFWIEYADDLNKEEPVRLLVIEDEDRLSGILKSKLGDVGFTVDIAGTASDAGAAPID